MAITASVGRGGVNVRADVRQVQELLNAWLAATGQATIPTDGGAGPRTVAAIEAYQARVLGAARPDGRIDPDGRSWRALAAGEGATPPLSGADWWHANQARFPNSASLADLVQPFRGRATAFVEALRAAGASVTISATRRNPARAALMHYSWQVAKGVVAPADVPAIAGAPIRWDHGDTASSRRAAQQMVDLFGIAYEPSLTSRHIEGRAVDMTIAWTGTVRVEDRSGHKVAIGTPRSGADNRTLHGIGAGYGVFKLLSDPPHWSDDGH
ncbi:MAG: peptidoglycan-binding protein [Sphingomonas sp.]|uniref:peptidoglycan-binding domain-containing protein n=1 Tax=Sphingomonas sp. TaxID=28214 RepID=UPI001B2CAD03|nr:peptidoglycan-binding domain-containing protein [Sphingomonas sp.]MBO9621355.1 peptidoglycan-binding protein [Sphingomonas sp.]